MSATEQNYGVILTKCFGVGVTCHIMYSFVVHLYVAVVDQIPRFGKRELICLLLFTCNYVFSVQRSLLSAGCLGWATLFYCGTL